MKSFITRNKAMIVIGKDAMENEFITTKYMKSKIEGILWFHVSNIPGAHVILVPDELNDITNEDIQMAADYAAKFCKYDKDKMNVSYCDIKDLVKPKNSSIGTFEMKKFKTIMGCV